MSALMLQRVQDGATHPNGRVLDDTGLDAVERLMVRLGTGAGFSRASTMVREHLATGGKRLRARLALAAADACGVGRTRAAPWAAACEMLHNATLVHDDVQDGDTVRRSQPTTWVRHGVAQAINAGDLMLMLPFRALESVDADAATLWWLSRATARAAELTVRGQSLEQDLLGARRLDASDWRRAAEGKTGALLALPVQGSARLAGLDGAVIEAVGDVFMQMGVLFQMYDDLLDLSDRKSRGRRGGDLYEGKVSALVVEHLILWPDDREWMLSLLGTPRELTSAEDVARAIERFVAGGAVAALRERIAACREGVLRSPVLAEVPELHAVAAETLRWMEHTVQGIGAAAGPEAAR